LPLPLCLSRSSLIPSLLISFLCRF